MRVAVTGSAGRLGRVAAEALSRHGHEVAPVDLDTGGAGGPVDLTDPDATRAALEGAEAVVHMARERFPYTEQGLYDRTTGTWRVPDVTGDSRRFERNVAMTYNVLAASASLEIPRLVIGSSLAVYGLYYPLRQAFPDYLPVDEDHPRRPQDPYGLSKLAGEGLCDGFARRGGVRIASLRFAGIADDSVYRRLIGRREDPMIRGLGSFWSYIDVRDAATACVLALEADFEGHQAFNICAPTTYLETPTRALLEQHLPDVRRVAFPAHENYCCYASGKARETLGFSPRHGPEA